MNPSLRLMTRADFGFADSLRALAGWNQTTADWRRFLACEPQGCFVAEWDGQPAGTATTIVHSSQLAWIGMVLVHPDYRRRGVGRALLLHCIRHLKEQGVRCIKLDATPAGQPVYEALGFRPEWTLTRWERAGTPAAGRADPPQIRPWRESDGERAMSLDGAVFGVPREKLLRELRAGSRDALIVEDDAGRLAGWGFLRDGSRAAYLGPVVADSCERAAWLIRALIQRGSGREIYWDIPDGITAARTLAREAGFKVQRPLTRMWLGDNATPGDPMRQFALAGPEVG